MTRHNFSKCEAVVNDLDLLASMLGSLKSVVEKEREHTLSVARQHKNQLVPAVRLPPELLEMIFGLVCLDSGLPSKRDFLRLPMHEHWLVSCDLAVKRRTLLVTCHWWNAIVNRQVSLWSRLHVRRCDYSIPFSGEDLLMGSQQTHAYGPSITTLLVDVSMPNIDIDVCLFNEVIDGASQTCRFLVYDYPPNQPTSHILHHGFTLPFPRLKTMCIYTGDSEHMVLELPLASQLQTLSIGHRDGQHMQKRPSVSWFPRIILPTATSEKLKHLSIECPVSNLEELLRACPELRTLRLDCQLPGSFEKQGPIRFPHLQYLHIHNRNDNFLDTADFFECPLLEGLHISSSRVDLLSKSSHFPHLRIFSFDEDEMVERAATFLQAHPLIEQILLPYDTQVIVPELIYYMQERPSLLPSLQVVKFEGRRRSSDMIDLLETRPGPDSDVSAGDDDSDGNSDSDSSDGDGDDDSPPALRVSPGSHSKTLSEKYRARLRRDPEVDWDWDALWDSCGFHED